MKVLSINLHIIHIIQTYKIASIVHSNHRIRNLTNMRGGEVAKKALGRVIKVRAKG